MGSLAKKIKALANHRASVFVFLGVLTLISFGVLIPVLGFYWDDLPYLFQYSVFGPAGFPEYVASDRPFSAWIFSATTALFGYNAFGYHLLILTLRWLCAALFFLICSEMWPKNKTENVIAASVFAVYPGFMQQPIALIYNHHFSVFAMLLASIYLMIRNHKREKPNILITLVSAALSFSMFSIENFAMLEFIRPFILWKLLRPKQESNKSAIRITALHWLPYLSIMILFLVWRVFIFKFPTYQPAGVAGVLSSPLQAISAILARIPRDLFLILVKAWEKGFFLPTISDFGRSATYLFIAVVVSTFTAVLFYFLLSHQESSGESAKSTAKKNRLEMLASFAILFLLAGSIVWGLDLPLEITFAWDRMTLAFFPAAGLFVAVLFSLLGKSRWIQSVALALLLTLAASANFQTGMAYKRDWDNLQDFLAQLSWRVPSLAENTIFITSEPGLQYYSDNSLTGPLNMQYREEAAENTISYYAYFTNARAHAWFEEDQFGKEIKKGYRSFVFRGNTDNAITYRFEPPACLQIMDGKYTNSITIPNLSERQVKEIRFTNLETILRTPTHTPLSPPFTASSPDSWCYYFEKADLARQFNDHAEIIRLGNEALAADKKPRDLIEWFPFLEGYLWQGDFETVKAIITEILIEEEKFSTGLCYTLQRVGNHDQFTNREALDQLLRDLPCD